MNDKLSIDTHLLVSVATGVVLQNISKTELVKVFSHLYGKNLSIKDIANREVQEIIAAEAYTQFPKLHTKANARKDWNSALNQAKSDYGDVVEVTRGMHSN